MSVNATFRESIHLEQLMPLNTVIKTIQHIAHNTQRLDSVQVAEMADLWLHTCENASFDADVSMSLRQSFSLSCECSLASLCSFSNLASSYFPS